MEKSNNRLTAANIKYLIVIKRLADSGKPVKCVNIAGTLNVSMPSVNSMLNKLQAIGLISKSRYGLAKLTPEGLAESEKYLKRYDAVVLALKKALNTDAELTASALTVLEELSEEHLDALTTD